MAAITTLDGLVSFITAPGDKSANSIVQSLHTLSKRDVGETILSSFLPGGADPLDILDPYLHTLGYLYILSARLSLSGVAPVLHQHIASFCETFNPVYARHAPDRVAKLARGIDNFAETAKTPRLAVEPLYNLLTRYPPSLSYLTSIHPLFLKACVASYHFAAALPVLSTPITDIDKALSDLTTIDHLQYHYLGGVALAALRKYAEAEEFLEIVVSSPAQTPSAVQLEAYKKLILVQLILHGEIIPLPKYTHPGLNRTIKSLTPYTSLIKSYPDPRASRDIVTKEIQFFNAEGNLGLAKIATNHAERWSLKGLTNTYLSLSLSQIKSNIALATDEEARVLVISMIEQGEISATLSPDGTLTFLDDTTSSIETYGPEAVDALLIEAQNTGRVLSDIDRNMAKSKELLQKALKEKEGNMGGMGGYREMGDDTEMWGSPRVENLLDE